MAVKLTRIITAPFQGNCYVLFCEETSEAVVIDPGGSRRRVLSTLEKTGAGSISIIFTHGHIDHTAAGPYLQRKTGAAALAHAADARRFSMLGFIWMRLRINKVDDGDEVPFCKGALRILHTPGHSPGSICVLFGDMLFSGDLLFAGGVGRWDLPRGSIKSLARSLRERLADLPDSVRVLPGHGPETTLGAERSTNPFFHPDFDPTRPPF